MYSSNPFSLRRSAVPLIFIALATFSCSDDDNHTPKDNEAPTVSLAGVPDDGIVWNTVTFTVSANDNVEVASIALEIDGEVKSTSTESTLEVPLNTQGLDDGEHTVTARGVDKAGNEKTVEARITVRNILISANIPADVWSGNSYQGYIFLSDEAGKTIAVGEFFAGKQFELRAPEFEGSKFFLTEVMYVEPTKTQGKMSVLQTYTGVKRGEWVVTGFGHNRRSTEVGRAQLSFTNALPNTIHTIVGANGGMGMTTTGEVPLSFPLYNAPDSKILLALEDVREGEHGSSYPTYYTMLPNPILAGNSYTIDLSTITTPTTEVTVPTEFDNGFIRLWGIADPSRPTQQHMLLDAWSSNGELKYNYPGDAFPQYCYYYKRGTSDGQYYYNRLAGLPTDLTTLNSTVDINFTNTGFNSTFSGNGIDACLIKLHQVGQWWHIFTPGGKQNVVLPEVPAMLSDIVTRNYQLNSNTTASAMDFSDFDGYDGLLDYVRTSTTFGLDYFEETGIPRHRMYTKYLLWNGSQPDNQE